MLSKRELIAKYKNFRHFLTSIFQILKAGYPARKLTVIGITGTDGKTTTTHLIFEIFKSAKKKVELVSTITAKGLHTTTPDATVLQPLLKKYLQQGIKYVILEVTSHGLDQHRVLGCNFNTAILTNVTHEHLDYHKTFENYRRTKAKLFQKVAVAILNKDDPSFEYFKEKAKKAKIISYGIKEKADFQASNIKTYQKGTKFTVYAENKAYNFKTKLLGEYNVSNILAAIACARTFNITWKDIQKTVSQASTLPGRMEFIQRKPFSIIVDFAHTPNGLKNVLQLASKIKSKKGKLITVFGSAGERDVQKRSMMAKIATRLADISVFTAEDPRSEDVNKILEQMARGARSAGGKENKTFFKIPERGEAIAYAIKIAKPGDTVGIFGKGHEKSIAYDHMEHPWSDQEFTRKVLQSDKQRAAIVLAGGKGTRMQSETPKVLHKIAGRPMIAYPLENLRRALFGKIVVVVGYKKSSVLEEIGKAVDVAIQPKPLGNAHAVIYGLRKISQSVKNVMIVQGDDSAFYQPETLAKVFEKHAKSKAKITLATIFKKDPGSLGVIKKDKKGNILGITHWDGKQNPPGPAEINCGLWVFDKAWLAKALPKIKKNEKGEYYLTDVIPIALSQRVKIQTIKIPNDQWVGVNTKEELAYANQKMEERLKILLKNFV